MRSKLFFFAVTVVVALACRGSSAHFPERHRQSAEVCPTTPRPPGYNEPTDGGGGGGSFCRADSECTTGRNGRCREFGNGLPTCTYDTCSSDADCGAGKACECDLYGGNQCLTANCRSDADCDGLGCSPTASEHCGNMHGTVGYYCHTKRDECVDDGDCKKGGKSGLCVYAPTGARWTCNYSMCVG